MDEKSKQGYVEISDDGFLIVGVSLTQPNPEIIALGILEKAKQSASAWLFQRHVQAKQAIKLASAQEKGLIDRILRRNNGI